MKKSVLILKTLSLFLISLSFMVSCGDKNKSSVENSLFNACEFQQFDNGQYDLSDWEIDENSNDNLYYFLLYNNDSTTGYTPQLMIYFRSPSFTGEHSGNNGSVYEDESMIWYNDNDSAFVSNVSLIISRTDEIDHVTITGRFNVDNKTYNISYSGFCENISDYQYENRDEIVQRNFQFSSCQYVVRQEQDLKWIDLYFDYADGMASMLQFWVDEDENTVIPVATYNITNTYERGTSSASFGCLPTWQAGIGDYVDIDYPDFILNPSTNETWYLRKGTIEVAQPDPSSKSVTITGRTTSYYGSTINFSYSGRITPWSNSSNLPKRNLNKLTPQRKLHGRDIIHKTINKQK